MNESLERKQRNRRYVNAWYQRNKAHHKARTTKWNQENREKVRVYGRKWQELNPEKQKAASDAWHENNKEYLNGLTRQRYAKDPTKYLKQNKQWVSENPEKVKQSRRQHYKNNSAYYAENARIRQSFLERAIPTWYEDDKVALLYQKRNELNALWQLEGNERFVVDHIIPLKPHDESVCGLHCWDNLQLLRSNVNGEKSDKYEKDW